MTNPTETTASFFDRFPNTRRRSAASDPWLAKCSALTVMAFCVLLAAVSGSAGAVDDWPQWRGPSRDGVSADFEPPDRWPESLHLVWEAKVGRGDGSPIVVDGRVYTVTRGDGVEIVAARDLATGDELWRSELAAPFKPLTIVKEHGAGPFSTPAISGKRMVTISINGVVSALSIEDGSVLWRNHYSDRFDRTHPYYGVSQSPLIVDGRVYVHVGGPSNGAFVALDISDGREVWQWDGDGPAYGAPVLGQFGDSKQIITLTQGLLVGLDAASGKLLWKEPFPVIFDVTALTPLVIGDQVVISGNRVPTRSYRVSREEGNQAPAGETIEQAWSVSEAWSNADVFSEYASPVLSGGRIFFLAFQKKGNLVALDPATGSVVWEAAGRLGETASLVALGEDLLLLASVEGELQVFQSSQDTVHELASYSVADSPIWSQVALVDQKVLVKDAENLKVFEVRPD